MSSILGGYIGINPPETFQGKCISLLATSSLVSLTVIALKVFGNISVCGTMGFTVKGIAFILAKTIPMAIIYSIGVNDLLDRFVYHPPMKKGSCCSKE